MTTPVDFIHDIRLADLPPAVVGEALRCAIDTLGVGMAGSRTDLSRIIRGHAARHFGGAGARLWCDGRMVSPAGAALANGMTIDAIDAHDGHRETKGHAGCGVLPALIALMEAEGGDAQEFLTGVVIGYEIAVRAGIALHAGACDYHTSGAWVALAAAGLGARRLGLSHAATREALGIAEYHGPRSQMMRCIDAPSMVKDGSGWGAMAGISAAYLAQDGFTGAPAITMEDPALAEHWADLGARWRIMEQYIKLYPVCRWAQPAVDAALALRAEHGFGAGEIEAIGVETFHEATRLATVAPASTEAAQYSLPFSVGAALARGGIGVEEVTGDALRDPGILGLSARVTMTEDAAFNAAFPARRIARVRIALRDGRVLRSGATEARGDPETRVDDDTISVKFHRLAGAAVGTQRAQALETALRRLAKGGSPQALFDALAGP